MLVDDTEAVYPVRIDPTFSDADWVSLNPGMPGADNAVFAIVADGNGNVYFGGSFTFIVSVAANRIAKWDGSSWSALGDGMSGDVRALAVSGTNLYVGGNFTTAGGLAATNIAKWNGSTWSSLGSGLRGGSVHVLAASGNLLYAGGTFTNASGLTTKYIARWNGSSWSALGSGLSYSFSAVPGVYALAVMGPDLYVGGIFTTAGGMMANCIAKWNGSTWSVVGSGSGMGAIGEVHALAVNGTDVYAAGFFGEAGGVPANRIAKWDGSSWSALGDGMSAPSPWWGIVYALAVSGTNLYAGGYFTTAGGVAVTNIAKWDGSTWSAVGSGSGMQPFSVSFASTGYSSEVYALAVSGTTLYAGGNFREVDDVTAVHIAKWDGETWHTFGSGIYTYYGDTTVSALALLGTSLYAGGYFDTLPDQKANSIAKWDGSTWSPLGSGITGPPDADCRGGKVHALAVSGNNLYVGGFFTNAGGVSAKNIARWNGSSWSALGSGMGGQWPEVFALAVSGNTLYAGGSFATAGGVTANRIARWNGSSWSALGSGMNGTVYALVVSGTELYAGGYFTTAGGGAASHIAKWNGSTWSALGAGMNGDVYALVAGGDTLYAGGRLYHGRRPASQPDRQMERQFVVGFGFGNDGGCPRVGSVWNQSLRRRKLYRSGRGVRQWHREMGRHSLVGLGFGDNCARLSLVSASSSKCAARGRCRASLCRREFRVRG